MQNVPLPPDGGIASPSTPGPKPRSVYITLDRIIKFKETPGCTGCKNKTRYHTAECRKRFQKLVDEEKELEAKSKPVSESVVVQPPSEVPSALEDAPVGPPPVDSIFGDEGKITIAVPYSVPGAATLPQTAPSCAELCRDSLPVFGAQPVAACPTVNQPPKSNNNRRKRRALKKSQRPSERSTLFCMLPQLTTWVDKRSMQY